MFIKKFENLISDKDYYDEVMNLISIIKNSGLSEFRTRMTLHTAIGYPMESVRSGDSVGVRASYGFECVFEFDNIESSKSKLNNFIRSDEYQEALDDENFIYSFILDIGYRSNNSYTNQSNQKSAICYIHDVDGLPNVDGDEAIIVDDQSIDYEFKLISSIKKMYQDATKSGWKIYKIMGNYIFIKY